MSKKVGRPKLKFDEFEVNFSLDAFLKIKKYCELAGSDEWLGFLLKDDKKSNENLIVINDIYFPPQTIGGASCSLKSVEFSDEIVKLISTKEGKDMLPKFCGWIHSHCDMNVFYSTTDDEANKRMRQYMPESKIFISAVVNNEMKLLGKAIIKTNGKDYVVDNVIFNLDYSGIKPIIDECTKNWVKAEKEIFVPVIVPNYKYYNNDVNGYSYKRSIKVPSKFKNSLTARIVFDISKKENKVVLLKNLPKEIKNFIKNYKIKLSKTQKNAVYFLFNALYHKKLSTDDALEIFGNDYKEIKTKVNNDFVPRDKNFKPFINSNEWKAWRNLDEYDEISYEEEEYRRQKQFEEDCYGY